MEVYYIKILKGEWTEWYSDCVGLIYPATLNDNGTATLEGDLYDNYRDGCTAIVKQGDYKIVTIVEV